MITFSTTWTADSGTKFFIKGEKVGISNRPMGARAVTPSLIRPGDSNQNAKALIGGKWVEASNYLHSIPKIWHTTTKMPQSVWLALPDGWHATDRSCIVSYSRKETIFTDGSTLEGDFALWFYAGMQRIDHEILYFAKESSENEEEIIFRQIGNKSTTLQAYDFKESPTVRRYSGGSGPVLRTPITNNTPYAIRMINGYSTVANGWADTIYSHPGCTLSLSSGGDAYSFSHWRDIPTNENTSAKTVLHWDEEHQEIVVHTS